MRLKFDVRKGRQKDANSVCRWVDLNYFGFYFMKMQSRNHLKIDPNKNGRIMSTGYKMEPTPMPQRISMQLRTKAGNHQKLCFPEM